MHAFNYYRSLHVFASGRSKRLAYTASTRHSTCRTPRVLSWFIPKAVCHAWPFSSFPFSESCAHGPHYTSHRQASLSDPTSITTFIFNYSTSHLPWKIYTYTFFQSRLSYGSVHWLFLGIGGIIVQYQRSELHIQHRSFHWHVVCLILHRRPNFAVPQRRTLLQKSPSTCLLWIVGIPAIEDTGIIPDIWSLL